MSKNNSGESYPLRKELVYCFLDIRYNPDYEFDKSILPGTPSKPKDVLSGFVKTQEYLWYYDSEKLMPSFLGTTWENLKPIFIDWYNDRFSKTYGKIINVFEI